MDDIGIRRARGRDGAAFRVGTVLAVLLLSAVGFAAALLLSGWADELQGDDRSGAHVLSNSAVGYKALLELLQETGVETELRRNADDDPDYTQGPEPPRIYTLPPRVRSLSELDESRWDFLQRGGPVLFVLPKWDVRALEDARGERRGWVEALPTGGFWDAGQRGASALEVFGPTFAVQRGDGVESYALDGRMAREISEALGGVTRLPDSVKVEDLQTLAPGWTDIDDWYAAQAEGEAEAGAEAEAEPEAEAGPVDVQSLPDPDPVLDGDTPLLDDDFDMDGDGDGEPRDIDTLFLEAIGLSTTDPSTLIGPDLVLDGAPVLFSVHDPDDGSILYHVLTDPDLLNTHGVATRTRARLALGIVDHMRGVQFGEAMLADGVAFDLSLHGFSRSSNIIKTLTRPPLLAATLCAVAALGLLIWTAFIRFGDPVRGMEIAHAGTGKRSLIDNGARLVHLARRTMGMADDYALMRRRRLLRDLGMDGAPAERVDTALAGLESRTGHDVDAAVARVVAANSPDALVSAARNLHDTVQEVS